MTSEDVAGDKTTLNTKSTTVDLLRNIYFFKQIHKVQMLQSAGNKTQSARIF